MKNENFVQNIGEKTMVIGLGYDGFMQNFIEKIHLYNAETLTESIITMIKVGQLEQVGGNFYKYKDFYILELLKKDSIDYSNKLKILEKLNLKIAQKYIETIHKDDKVYIITKIPGTEIEKLAPLWKIGNKNISKSNRLEAFREFQKLTEAGYVDDNILTSDENWYVNAENKIIIPSFEYLRPITPQDNTKDIMNKYYNILFN